MRGPLSAACERVTSYDQCMSGFLSVRPRTTCPRFASGGPVYVTTPSVANEFKVCLRATLFLKRVHVCGQQDLATALEQVAALQAENSDLEQRSMYNKRRAELLEEHLRAILQQEKQATPLSGKSSLSTILWSSASTADGI